MQYMRCKCGESTCWTSMGHPSCSVCKKCGSTYGYSPDTHPEQTPHEFYADFHRGKLETRCSRCHELGELKDAVNYEEVKAQANEIAAAFNS